MQYMFSHDNAQVVSRVETLSAVVCLYFKEVMLTLCLGMLIHVFDQINPYRANIFSKCAPIIKYSPDYNAVPYLESQRLMPV